jgi:class 3 adenylate cyclase/HAMP domain-containing protein
MKIRVKIFLVVLPLIIVSLCLAETASYFNAVNGVSRITRQFLSFKASELEKYAENQWSLLVENGYAGNPDMVDAAKQAVENYGRSIILSGTELILALDPKGNVVMSTASIEILPPEQPALAGLLQAENQGIMTAKIGGTERVFCSFFFPPFQWYILLTEEKAVFYRDANRIAFQTIVTLAAAITAAAILLILFSRHLTRPLSRVIQTMKAIISSADLSSRVEVEYQDETGELARTFNLMTGELDKAYSQIKRYAFDAVLAGKKETRIRHIFQKYVPKDLIDKFFASPESMLTGENRELAILFSDIRGFTTISESMAPDDLVNSLNRYFSGQVDIIMNRNGIVDKYIGDAIMAFWGAPVKHDDDALSAVLSGLDMIDALAGFNENQRKLGKKEFNIGIGINYGIVTVGNIGSERKMDYTVIGDAVNLASRMEGLTKTYHSELLISEFLYEKIRNLEPKIPARLLDTVAVKGKTKGVKIYTVGRGISPSKTKAWAIHNAGMDLYYRRSFAEAALRFRETLALLPGDFNADNLYKRCEAYARTPPPPEWDGVEVMHSK